MQKSRYYIFVLLLISGCIVPYEFDAVQSSKMLAVDALLTDEETSHFVRLSYTVATDSFFLDPLTGARVWFEDQNGETIPLTEHDPGEYLTEPDVKGVVGESYSLHIETPDGEAYASTPEKLIKSSPIDSLYGLYRSLPSPLTGGEMHGVQLFLETSDPDDESSGYKYEWTETYRVDVPYPAEYQWSKASSQIVPRDVIPKTCYTEVRSNTIILANTGQSASKISELPVRFIDEMGTELRFRYSIEVQQHALGHEAYQYYRKLKENTESGGTLFDQQKGTIIGNIRNLNDDSEIVLGYFEVAGISRKLIFLSPEQFEDDGFRRSFSECNNDYVTQYPVNDIYVEPVFGGNASEYAVFVFNIQEGNLLIQKIDGATAYIVPKICGDCQMFGTLTRPDFWID